MDRTIYILLYRFKSEVYVSERRVRDAVTPEQDLRDLITDIVTGEIEGMTHVFSFNPSAGWSKDISKTVAAVAGARAKRALRPISDDLRRFVEDHWGIGTVLEAAA